MNRSILKSILSSTLLVLGAGYMGIASAHCPNNLTLAAAQDAADVYRIMCSNGDGSPEAPSLNPTTKLFTRINLQSATVVGESVAVQLGREGFTQSVQVTDTSTGAATGPAPACTTSTASGQTALTPGGVGAGNGEYNILVNKRGTGAKTYGLIFHCQDNVGIETVTTEVHSGFAAPEITGNSTLSPDIDLAINR
ncbi:MAG: hypothetical protein Q8N35_11375 [Methylococcaceae bacterium]|nr:hypothetical protein [Methylococcaceae bacterium]MDZ4156603.1 hypothetical protein [Methylococcales bacterium]MDP2394753.1 hypothetical protein [Methylococcaceae bacterium]MDP3020175.1 hypothetical protein [Methylococcaceae bacterium]MDP3390715.1 hypothetical protein [Methylococcaceae bacterium]